MSKNCIQIMSRNMCIHKLKQKLEKKCIIISINDFNYKREDLPQNKDVIDILRLEFDDIDRVIIQDGVIKNKPISNIDTIKIKNFFFKYINLLRNEQIDLWVHCTMGVSRSAAVAFILAKYLYGDDLYLFETGDYVPLKYIYIKMSETFGMKFSEEEFYKKKKISSEVLRKKMTTFTKEKNGVIKFI